MLNGKLIDIVCGNYFDAYVKAKTAFHKNENSKYSFQRGILKMAKEVATAAGFWLVIGDLRAWLDDKFSRPSDPVPTREDYCRLMGKIAGFNYDADGNFVDETFYETPETPETPEEKPTEPEINEPETEA